MNIQQLEYIVALDKYKNFSKAADACHITQATLSTMVKRLEEELGIIIFDRKKSPVITTELGIPVIEEAKDIIYRVDKLKNYSKNKIPVIEGYLSIGIIPTISGSLLHRILPEIKEKYPKLNLTIRELTTQDILAKLKIGELDAGILSTPLQEDLDMEEDVLYYEKLVVYGTSETENSTYLTPERLKKDKVWLLEEGNCLTNQIMNICNLAEKSIDNLEFKPNSFDSLLNLVDQFNGLTLLPELYYQDLPKNRQKNIKDFQSPYPVREVSMVYYRPYSKFRSISAISELIKSQIIPKLEAHKHKKSELRIANM